MQDSNTDAIRTAERIRQRVNAVSGAAVAISAASNKGLTPDEVFQMLDVIAEDLRRNADLLIEQLTR